MEQGMEQYMSILENDYQNPYVVQNAGALKED